MVDYSKWKKIEISDDEDETHPNIDTPSLFRWRHRAREERDQELRQLTENLKQRRMKASEMPRNTPEEVEAADAEMKLIEKDEADLEKKQRLRPFNVDSIGKETWDSTVINKEKLTGVVKKDSDLLDENTFMDYTEFVEQNEEKLKEFSFLNGVKASRRFLLNNPNIANKFSLDWMHLRCVDLSLHSNKALLQHTARQAVILEMILEIAKSLGRGCDPRTCLPIFFDRYRDNSNTIDGILEENIDIFLQRVNEAVQFRLKDELEKAQKEVLVGPGGLDPNVVFKELNPELQEAFIERDKQKLVSAFAKMKTEDVQMTLQRCIDAGLWCDENVDEDEQEFMDFQTLQQKRQTILEEEKQDQDIGKVEDEEVELKNVFTKVVINSLADSKDEPVAKNNTGDSVHETCRWAEPDHSESDTD